MRKGRLVDKPGSGTGRWRESVLGWGRRVIDRPGTNGRAGEAAGRDLTVSWRLQGGSARGAERALHLVVPAGPCRATECAVPRPLQGTEPLGLQGDPTSPY